MNAGKSRKILKTMVLMHVCTYYDRGAVVQCAVTGQWMRYTTVTGSCFPLTRCNFHHKSVTSPITAYPTSLISHESTANIVVRAARTSGNHTPTRWSTCCINILYVNLNDVRLDFTARLLISRYTLHFSRLRIIRIWRVLFTIPFFFWRAAQFWLR